MPTSVASNLFNTTLTSFINNGGQIYNNQTLYGTGYIDHRETNNQAGLIYINTNNVVAYQRSVPGMTYDQAYNVVLAHELGHYYYQTRDAIYGPLATTQAEQTAFCLQREGEGTYFAYNVAKESLLNGVPMAVAGVNNQPNLYNVMDTANSFYSGQGVSGYNLQLNNIRTATNFFADDVKYKAFCALYPNNQATPYLDPSPPTTETDPNSSDDDLDDADWMALGNAWDAAGYSNGFDDGSGIYDDPWDNGGGEEDGWGFRASTTLNNTKKPTLSIAGTDSSPQRLVHAMATFSPAAGIISSGVPANSINEKVQFAVSPM